MSSDSEENTENYSRLNLILVKGGTLLTKELLKRRVKELCPHETIDMFLKNKKAAICKRIGKQYEKVVYPPNGETELNNWNLYLFCCVLLTSCSLVHINQLDVDKILKMRNKLFHLHEPIISNPKCHKKIEKLKTIFKRTCELIDDPSLEEHMENIVERYEKQSISKMDVIQLNHLSNRMEVRLIDITEKNEHAKVPSLGDRWNQKCDRPRKEACRYDGRLILLSNEDINEIKEACTQEQIVIGRGGFGTGYKQWNSGFGMRIAIKKIVADNDAKTSFAREEILASRILHPFILPLFSVFEDHTGNNTHVYFISPHCEKGDLYSVLKECRKNQVNSLNQMQRTRIALQLALAIQYLHTPVPNVRGIILHTDICSLNVVLDEYNNARLTDFGFAWEKDDMTTTASGKPHYLHPDVGKLGMSASVFWDYYSLGVVIRELLTGLPPSGNGEVHLRFMSHYDIISNLALIWPTDDEDSERKANALNTAAQRCLDAKEGTFEIKMHVIDEIKAVLNVSVMDLSETNKCALCMINPDGSDAAKQMKHQPNCRDHIRLCIACEKNSFLNPVTCYSCSATLEPSIGYGWGALLVAGNDTDSDENANAFKTDMERMRNVFTSRAPLVMGIREEHVRTVALKEPGRNAKDETLLPLVTAAVEEISKMDIHTLVVYFSCHGGKNGDNFFQLASKNDKLTLRSFQEMLSQLTKVDKIIVMLDHCFPDKLTLPPKEIVQLNACGRDEFAPVQAKESLFTKYLIRGLQAKTHGNMCEKDKKKCKHCEDYWATRNDYITVGSLLAFVAGHMESEGSPNPRCYLEGNADDVKLAYYTDEEIYLEFIGDGDKTQDIKQVPVGFCQNLDELKKQLFNNVDGKDVEVCIKNDTFRKENRFEICDTIDKVMMAWVLRKRLIVQLLERGSPGETTVLYQRIRPGTQS